MDLRRPIFDRQLFLLCPKIAGLFCVLLGVVVLAGWYAGSVSIVRIHHSFVAMQHNTALAFVSSGVGLLGMAYGWRRTTLCAGTILLIIAAPVLAEHVLDLELGIDRLNLIDPTAEQAPLVARMSFVSALCFALAGAAVVLYQIEPLLRRREAIAGVSGALILAAGSVAIIGNAGGWDAAYGRAQNVGVAFHTAVGFVAIGCGLLAFVLAASAQKQSWPNWVSGTVAVSIATLSVALWFEFHDQESANIRQNLKDQIVLIESDIRTALRSRVLALSRMADRSAARKDAPRDEWEQDAENYLVHQPDILALVKTDSRFVVVGRVDDASFETGWLAREAISRKDVFLPAGSTARRNLLIDGPVSLADGSQGFLLFLPITSVDEFKGLIVAVMDVDALIDGVLTDDLLTDFGIEVSVDGTEVYVRHREERENAATWAVASNSAFSGHLWAMRLWPTAARRAQDYSALPETVLVSGLVAALLVALSIYFALAARANEERARMSERRTGLILDTAGEGIYGLDLEGRTTFANKAAEVLLGYSVAEMVGRSQHALIHHHRPNGSVYPREECRIYKAFRDGEVSTVDDEVFWRKDGTAMPVEYTSRPILNKRDEIEGAVVVFHDISARKKAEAERESLIAKLKRSNVELDNFAHIASHDLKEPLRAIHNHTEFLFEDYADKFDEDGVRRLNRLRYLTERMERLIGDLLYFSRLGREGLSIHPTDLNAVVGDIRSTLEDVLEEQNAGLEVPRPLPTIECDKVKVTQLFQNLIENAVKYNESSEKRVEIGMQDPKEEIFYVKDNGIGIAPGLEDDVFRIFKRLHSDKKYSGGTGSGLTFVKKIVEQHGGKIWLESMEGTGTTFFFTLKQEGPR